MRRIKDWNFWECVDGEAAETFVSFETEDVISPGSGKTLFKRLLEEGYSGSQIEHILYKGFCIRGKRCDSTAVMFLKKKRAKQWRESEIAHGARSEDEPSKKIAREYEHPERQRENAYCNLRRVLIKDFLLFLLSKEDKFYRVSEMIGSIPIMLRRRGLQAWKDQKFKIGAEEIRKENALMERTDLDIRNVKFYKQQIETLLEELGFPLRENSIIHKIIAETKPCLPQIVELDVAMGIETDSPDRTVLKEEIARESREFFASLTEEEKHIQKLRYQVKDVVPFEKIGEALNPKRSGEHYRNIDREIRERMKDLFIRKDYYPPGEKIKNFINFFLEEIQNYNL